MYCSALRFSGSSARFRPGGCTTRQGGLPVSRDGSEEGWSHLELCIGDAGAEDTGGESEFRSPPYRELLQEWGARTPPRWPLSVLVPPGPRADAGALLSSRQQRLFSPTPRWGAAGRR